MPAQELVVLAKRMAAAAGGCCPLRAERQSACVEDQVSTLVSDTPAIPLTFCPPVPGINLISLDISMTCQWGLGILRGESLQAAHANGL